VFNYEFYHLDLIAEIFRAHAVAELSKRVPGRDTPH
jgi:hypothetical protein